VTSFLLAQIHGHPSREISFAPLTQQITEDAVMYVGHLPNIENVVSTLVIGNENSSILKFQNSAIACIEIHADESHIKWFITPELCS